MMAKFSKKMLASYIAIATFVFLLLILLSFFQGEKSEHWWRVFLLETRIFYLPIIVYLLVISCLVGVMAYLFIAFLRRASYHGIEEKLHLLTSNNFDSPLISEKIPHAADNRYLAEIDVELNQVAAKMKKMSTDLQILNSRPQVVAGETKEEILEQERHRLARELHDSVSQQLFAAMMMMSAIDEQAEKNDVPAAQRKQLKLVTEIINASQSEMRALLLHLRPVSLEGKSLKVGIEQLLRELQTKIKISLKWEIEDISISPAIEDQLFRVVQELLSNTLRHAKADELEVYLNQVGQNILLRVIDDGVGFDTSIEKAGSYGLMNIRERIAAIGGTFKLISFIGQGTNIEIKVPLLREVKSDD